VKKLLYVHNNSIASGGSQNTTLLQIFSMCNAFVNIGFEVVLAMEGNTETFEEEVNSFVKSSFKFKNTFRTINWEKRSKYKIINRIHVRKDIKEILQKEKPELVFTREPIFLRTILNHGFPTIYESHNAKQHKRIFFVHLFILNEIINLSKRENFLCLFSISSSLLNFWETKGISKKKLFAWHDGFDASLFRHEISKLDAKKSLNLHEKKKIITYTGGLYPDREIEKILDLAEYFSDYMFVIIGGPDKYRMLYKEKALYKNISNINFLGFIKHNDIPSYLYASDVLLAFWSSNVPTINYCSPLKLFEYMASGRVILAHGFPTVKEILVDNEDAVICEPEDHESVLVRLKDAIAQSRDNIIGTQARVKAFRLYTWDNRVRKLMEFLNDNMNND